MEYEDSKDLEGLLIQKKRQDDIESKKSLQKTKDKDSESAESPSKLSPSPVKKEKITVKIELVEEAEKSSPMSKAVSRFSNLIEDVVGGSPTRDTAKDKLLKKLSTKKKDNTIRPEDDDCQEMEALKSPMSPFSLALKGEGSSFNQVAPAQEKPASFLPNIASAR